MSGFNMSFIVNIAVLYTLYFNVC